jgi:threonine dehydratase
MTTASESLPTFDDVASAAQRIAPYAHRTPVLTCRTLDCLVDGEVFFKCENFQKVGAFKFRGACNAVFSLSDKDAARGVLTHSSGNHAQALALAASLRGIDAHIVMPRTAPPVKVNAVQGYGGKVIFCEPTLASREQTAEKVRAETGAVFIHPYNDPRIIAGQGTAALELIEEKVDLDIAMAPVGGGGLMSGTLLSFAHLSPDTAVIGAEPEGADDAARSLLEGKIIPSVDPDTIADGLLTSLGSLTFEIIRRHILGIVTVSDEQIVRAMRLVWERMKVVIEPSAAVPVATLLEKKVDARGKAVGVILSGGNADLERLPWSPAEDVDSRGLTF